MYRVFVVLVSLLLICASCGSTNAQKAAESPTPTPQPVVFATGHIPASALLMVGDGAAVVQDIAAEGERIRSLQLLLAAGVHVEHPLLVEIRSPDLMVRYGYASIQTSETNPAWVSFDVEMLADLEIGRAYALVLTSTKSNNDAWWVAVADASTYPYGKVRKRDDEHAMAFRAEYTSGTLTESMIALPDKPPHLLTMGESARRVEIAVNAYPYTMSHLRPHNVRYLPECIGMLCADYSNTLLPDAEERKKRASQAFEFCSQGEFPIARAANPEFGISCRDVCAASSYSCAATVSLNKDTCEIADDRSPRRGMSSSCDAVVSETRARDSIGCVCSPAAQISFDVAQKDIEKVVREGFYLDGNTPRIIQGKTPYGVTCSDVCLTLADSESFSRRTASEAITPWSPSCTCGRRGTHPTHTSIKKLEGYALIPWRGKTYVYDVKKHSVRKLRQFDGYSNQKGRFVIWKEHTSNHTFVVDAKTGKSQRVDSKCELYADGDALWSICLGRGTTLQKVGSTKVFKAPRMRDSPSNLRAATIRGQVLTVRTGRDMAWDTYSWTIGNKSWTKTTFTPELSPGWEAAYLLDEVLRRNPKHPRFKHGLYWSKPIGYKGLLWAYDPAKRQFLTWDLAHSGIDLGGSTINSRNGVFNPETRSFLTLKNSRGTVLFGNVGVGVECPEGHVCESLPEPLQLLKTFKIDARHPSVRVQKATIMDVEVQ